ncbi:hypothetical protein BaRGS_00001967 [Batillaria attramentaria]|uniref:Anaphase-promoting complex subunit 4 WD40 domain-containing protein n=1 Tax=Batillaria attramentaria TaxID=370345 RepID=A0ABD0M470_9CAEN
MARRIWEDAMKTAAQGGSELDVFADLEQGESTRSSNAEIVTTVKLDRIVVGTSALQYNYDGTVLAAGFRGGAVKLFDPLTGKMLRGLMPNTHGGHAVLCLRFHPTKPDLLYSTTAEGHVYLINIKTAEATRIITDEGNEINCLDFSNDGNTYAISGKSLDVYIYQTKTNKLIRKYEGNWGTQVNPDVEGDNAIRLFALKYVPHDWNAFITAGNDNHIKVWDNRSKQGIIRRIHGPYICGDALDMRDDYILAGSWCANHALQVFDYGEGTLVREIDFPSTNGAFLYCAQYCDNNVVLAGGSGTNSACVLEVLPGETQPKPGVNNLLTVQCEQPVQTLDSANGGRLFAVGGEDNYLKLCTMS